MLVCGSRDWDDYGAIYRRLAEFGDVDRGSQQVVVVHGDAKGADTMAAQAARDLGYHVRAYPADWSRLGKRAGIVRNKFMLETERPQAVLAFWKDQSPGTKHAVETALDMGLYVEVHNAKEG